MIAYQVGLCGSRSTRCENEKQVGFLGGTSILLGQLGQDLCFFFFFFFLGSGFVCVGCVIWTVVYYHREVLMEVKVVCGGLLRRVCVCVCVCVN